MTDETDAKEALSGRTRAMLERAGVFVAKRDPKGRLVLGLNDEIMERAYKAANRKLAEVLRENNLKKAG